MAKYINVDEALKKVGHVQIKSARNDIALAEDRRAIADWLQALPEADVQEVRHGKWELVDEYLPRTYACSVCHRIGGSNMDAYCFNCGAKMNEVEHDGGLNQQTGGNTRDRGIRR